jgi:hypothetical protein
LPIGWRRQLPAIAFERYKPFINDLAHLRVHFRFIVAMTTRSNNSGALADKGLILIRPFHDLDVSSTSIHVLDS